MAMNRDHKTNSTIAISRFLGFFYVGPGLVWTFAFFAIPMLIMVAYSVFQRTGGKLVTDISATNYVEFFSKDYQLQGLYNSLEIAGLTTVVSVVLAYPVAYYLAFHVSARWQRLGLMLAILPFWTSYIVRSYSWLLVLSGQGIISQALQWVGLSDGPISFAHQKGSTILGFTHFFTMLLILTIFANLVQIPRDYARAAIDLGASRLQVFCRITLPLSVPGIMIGAFLTFVLAIGDYMTPQILGGNKELVLPQIIMLQVQRHADFPLASAMSMVMMVVVILMTIIFARWLKMDRV